MNASLGCEPRARLDPSVRSESADENPKGMFIPPFPGPTTILLQQFWELGVEQEIYIFEENNPTTY